MVYAKVKFEFFQTMIKFNSCSMTQSSPIKKVVNSTKYRINSEQFNFLVVVMNPSGAKISDTYSCEIEF